MKRAVLTIGRRVEVKTSKSDRHGQMARGSQSWARLFVRNLPPTLRTAFQLRDFEGLPLQEIAGILGITIGATKTRVSRARATRPPAETGIRTYTKCHHRRKSIDLRRVAGKFIMPNVRWPSLQSETAACRRRCQSYARYSSDVARRLVKSGLVGSNVVREVPTFRGRSCAVASLQ